MTEFFDWVWHFIERMFAVPELYAIVTAVCVGLATTYLLTLPLPAWTPVKAAVQYSRVLIFFVVVVVAVSLIPTPRVGIWAVTVGLFVPLGYEWLTAIIFHRWPWLKPKALLTAPEMQTRIEDKAKP